MSKNATALALRLAKTYNVDLSTLSGSGSDGTVTARDVLERRNHVSLSPTDSGSEASTQKAEAVTVFKTASQRAPRAESFTQEAEIESVFETALQRAPQAEGSTQRAEAVTVFETALQRAPQAEGPTQKAETESVVKAASRPAPRAKGSTQEAEAVTALKTALQRARQAERRPLVLALEEESSSSHRSDDEIPRWMFWRRRSG